MLLITDDALQFVSSTASKRNSESRPCLNRDGDRQRSTRGTEACISSTKSGSLACRLSARQILGPAIETMPIYKEVHRHTSLGVSNPSMTEAMELVSQSGLQEAKVKAFFAENAAADR